MKTNKPTPLQAANWKRAGATRAIKGAIGVLNATSMRYPIRSDIVCKIMHITKLLDELLVIVSKNYLKEKEFILTSKDIDL